MELTSYYDWYYRYFPQALIQEFIPRFNSLLLLSRDCFLLDRNLSVALQAIRKVPVQMAKLQQANGGMPTGAGARSFIPLKVNS